MHFRVCALQRAETEQLAFNALQSLRTAEGRHENWGCGAQAAGMLFLRQQSQAQGKGRLGIHPVSWEVKKLGAGATLYAAVQMLQQVRLCMYLRGRVGLRTEPCLAWLCFALLRMSWRRLTPELQRRSAGLGASRITLNLETVITFSSRKAPRVFAHACAGHWGG